VRFDAVLLEFLDGAIANVERKDAMLHAPFLTFDQLFAAATLVPEAATTPPSFPSVRFSVR
jgi:hypothetical protein